MRILLTSIVLLCVFSCSSKPDVASFTKQLTDSLNQAKGNFALSFRDLQTGQEIHINEHRLFHAASTMKTPVMIELYKQAGAESDSESELYTFAGKKRPISELVYKMIILSSNLATNILIELVDAKNVTQTMRDLGAKDILVLRGVEDGKAFRAGLNNKVTAYDLMLIFSAISDGKVEGSEDMINILLDQKFNDIIPARLPKDVKVAHKTGWITGLHHDSALVILPDGRKYVLVLLSDSLEDEEAGVKTMATVSRLIYDFLTENTE